MKIKSTLVSVQVEIKKRILVHQTTLKSKPEDENYHKYVNSTDLSKNTSIKKKRKYEKE